MSIVHHKPAQAEIEQVRLIVTLLHRGYQAFEFYPFNHPVVQQLAEQLYDELQAFFQMRIALELELYRFHIQYFEHLIFEETNPTNNFIYLLFSDGIRKLIFDVGLTKDESSRFFGVLHSSSRRRSIAEDTVTLLWEQQFYFIRYYLLEDLTELYLPDLQALYENMLRKAAAVSASPHVAHNEPNMALQAVMQLARSRLQPTVEEVNFLQQLLYEEDRGLMRRFLEIISRILEHNEESAQFDRLVDVLSQLQPILMYVGDIEHLGLCLAYISRLSQIFIERKTERSLEWHCKLEALIRQAHSEQMIKKLISVLEQSPDSAPLQASVEYCLGIISPPNADILLQGIVWTTSVAVRQFWIKCLTQKYRANPRPLVSGVHNANPLLARYTCTILGEIGHESSRAALQSAANREESAVRAEAMRCLLRLGASQVITPQLFSALKRNLEDRDPEVRKSAIMGLLHLGTRSKEFLQAVYDGHIYEAWSEDEQQLLFDITVRIGQRFHECIDLMIDSIIKQYKGWFASRRDPHIPRYVVQALHRNGNPRAIAAIEKLYDQGSDMIRAICKEVLR